MAGARRGPVQAVRPQPRTMLEPAFSRALEHKLRRLRRAEPAERPRFVTTVRAGAFLLPPPEVASLLGLHALYPPPERVYSYASKPRRAPEPRRDPVPAVLAGARQLAAGVTHVLAEPRNGSAAAPYTNVMHDKRVVRGSTFTSHALAAGDGAESAAARAARTRRRALARRAAAARLRAGSPPPAPGRRHLPVQTERYLEELFERGVELEVGVQTDLLPDRPASPRYVPARTGADAATQVYPGELFDFELEAQPVLEALVGKTAEQALAEVAQEEELGALREQQRRYCELRDAERAERARLAAQHARLHDEKERRVAEARVARDAAQSARERVAAAALVQGYVAELLPGVLAGLRDQGYLLERSARAVHDELLPWLVGEVSHEIESIITSRDVLTEIVREVVESRAELAAATGARAAARPPPPDSLTPPSEPALEEEHEPVPEE